MNQNAGPLCRIEPLCRARARAGRSAQAEFSGRGEGLHHRARQVRSLWNRGRAAAFDAVVHQDQAAGRARDRGRGKRRDHHRSRELQDDLSELDAQHSRLVHLAAVVVGTPHSGVALQVRRNYCRPRGAGEMYEMRRFGTEAGHRCARYLVFFRAAAVHHSGLAGKDARSGSFLSDDAVDHRLRDPVFLGRPHDHVRLPLHAGPPAGSAA